MSSVWKWQVPQNWPNGRADHQLLTLLQETGEPQFNLTRSRLQKLFEEGLVYVDGRPIKASAKLKPGQNITVTVPAPVPLEVLPEDLRIEILYEDEHLIVVNKPPGMNTHPTDHETTGTLVNALLFHADGLSGIGGKIRPGIVHRLDKNTSGAMVVAKTDACHEALSMIFSRHAIERAYWALCYSALSSEKELLKVESLIGRNPDDRKRMTMDTRRGKKAITWVKTLERYGKKPYASWIEARLETGRTHQIRVHLTSLHCSVLGDPVYGTPSSQQAKWKALPSAVQSAIRGLPGQALHARILGFEHPITQKQLYFEATPPLPFQQLHSAMNQDIQT